MPVSTIRNFVVDVSHKHGALLIVQTIVAIANTMANSFALVYLVRQGMGYTECAVFIMICVGVPIFLLAFASRVVVKNFAASMETAMICLALYYSLLVLLSGWALIVIPPILFGIYIVTMWVPYNALIMHISSVKKRAATIGVYFLVWPLVTTIAPLGGGIIITLWSYDALFVLGALLSLADLVYVAGWKVFRNVRQHVIIPELLQSLRLNLVTKRKMDIDLSGVDRRISWAIFAEGVQDGIFWLAIPLISFEYATDEATLSGYLSLFSFWGALMTVGMGILSDRLKDRVGFLRVGAVFAAMATVFAAYSTNAEGYVTAMSFTYFWLAAVPPFLFTILLDRLEKFKKKSVLVRELGLALGRTLGVGIVVAALLMGADLKIMLSLAGVALASMVIVR